MNCKNLLKLLILFIGMFSVALPEANATHFRYGTITWERVAGQPTQVRYRITQAWRRTFFSPLPNIGSTVNSGSFYPGAGSTVNVPLVITSMNTAEDWIYGEYTFIKDFGTATGNFTAYFDGCCRISALKNNNDQNYRVSTVVTLGNSNDAPVSSVPPFINLPVNAVATYQIPATDPNGDVITYSLAPNGQFGGGTVQPAGFSISPSGLLSVNTTGFQIGGIWNVAVFITDSKGARIQVDLMIRITTPSTPPVFDYTTTPANNTTYVLQPGQPLSFNVKASDVDAGDVVNLSAVGLPVGSTFAPASGNPVTRTFSWTPSLTNVGTFQVNFLAQDVASIQTSTIVNIAVSTKPNFVAPSIISGSILCNRPGDTIRQTYHATDVDTADRIILSLVTPQQLGMSFSPALPTSAANPASSNFTWATTSANWGVNTVIVRATDKYSETREDTVTYIVNTPPQFATGQTDVILTAGQPFSYTFSGTDADIAFGDSIILSHTHIPSWMSISDNGNGTWTLSGTPTLADSGDHHATLQIQDLTNHYNGTHCGDATQSFQITVLPCNITTSISATNALCNGSATGTINLTVNNATSPVTYAWSNGDNTEDIQSAIAGNYSVSITDANGCTATDNTTIEEPTAISTNISGTDNICKGASSGAIDLSVSGGTPGYTYLWNNNATSQDLSGLAAGNYSVTVTDANGCTANTAYTVAEPATSVSGSIAVSPTQTVSGQSNYTIFLGYGPQSVTLNAAATGGTPGYTYNWSPAAGMANPSMASVSVSPTSTTTYTVTITDANGCTKTVSRTIYVVNANCGKNKVSICHNGNTICVSVNAIPAHLDHGDKLGNCQSGNKNISAVQNENEAIVVYPNPSTGIFSVSLPTGVTEAYVSVTDMTGKLVSKKSVTDANTIQIDLGGNASGVYMINISTNNNIYQTKVTLQ